MNRRVCCFLLLLLASIAGAQPYKQLWAKTFNGTADSNDLIADIEVDASDNIYVFGSTTVTGGGVDFLLRKYDPSGGLTWSRTLARAGDDAAVAMELDKNGGIYLAGIGTSATESSEYLIAKYNSAGGFVYSNKFNLWAGAPSPDELHDLAVDEQGRAFVCGRSFDSSTIDFTVVAFDPAGNKIWHKNKNGADGFEDSANAIIVGEDGYVYASGAVLASTDVSNIAMGKWHPETGAESWFTQQTPPYGGSAKSTDCVYEPGGALLVLSQVGRSGGGVSMFLMRVSTFNGTRTAPNIAIANNGTLPIAGTHAIDAYKMAIDKDGIVYCAGRGGIDGKNYMISAVMNPAGGGFANGSITNPTNGFAGSGKVVPDSHGAGHFVGTLGSSIAGQGHNMIVKRMIRNGQVAQVEYDAGFTQYSQSIAIDSKDEVIAGGHAIMANGKYDIFIVKYTQRPYAMPDVYHAYRNKTLTVSAADGVFKNDIGSLGASAVKDSNLQHGTVNLAASGGFTFVPTTDYSGVDQFLYHGNKGTYFGENGPAVIYIHPGIASLSIPDQMMGGDEGEGLVTLTGPEPAVPTSGTHSGSPSNLLYDFGFTWLPGAGASTDKIGFYTRSVTSNQVLTVTVSRGGTSASDTTVLKPGGLIAVSMTPSNFVGGDEVVGKVTLSAPAPPGGMEITLEADLFTVVPPAKVTVVEGQTSATFGLPSNPVTQTTTFDLDAVRGFVQVTASGTLRPPPKLLSVGVAYTSVHGGQSLLGSVTLDSGANLGGTTVALADNSSAITVPAQAIVPTGTSSKTFDITTMKVGASATRQITATLGGITKTVSLTLIPSPSLVSLSVSPSSVFGGQSTTGRVDLSAAPTLASGVAVQLTDNSTFITTPSTGKVNQGSTFGTFTITTGPVSATASRTVTAALNGISKSATITLKPGPSLASLGISPSTVKGGVSSNGTVTLTAPAPAPIVVQLSDNSSALNEPASVTVLTGNTSANFTITTTVVSANATRTVSATLGSTTKSASITLTP